MRALILNDRKKLAPWGINDKLTNTKRTAYDWLPIHELNTAEVFATIAQAGQQPHAMYAKGNERLSCVFCIFGSKGDIARGMAGKGRRFLTPVLPASV